VTTVYLNGTFLPVENACISVMDRGFLFGDGVYEVIPAYGGNLFRLHEHLNRLQNSLDGIRLANPLSDSEWETILNEVLESNRPLAGTNNDQSVYLQVTRGSAEKRDHSFPEAVRPTVFVMSAPLPDPDPALTDCGAAAVTLDDTRWQLCNIKAVTLLPNVLLRQQAKDQNAAEAILIRDHRVIEGSASNVFVIKDGNVLTPPKSQQMLPGITRDLVLELARRAELPCKETDIEEALLRTADEIWLTSSTREVMPVTRLDGNRVGDGSLGPVWKTIIALYRDYKAAVRQGKAQ
jgi:D-alanine transaminase